MLGRIMESCNRRDEVKSREEVGRKKERREEKSRGLQEETKER